MRKVEQSDQAGDGQGLSKPECQELVDLLRKNLLYQTPRPCFADESDPEPTWVQLKLIHKHYCRILELLHQTGGWVLPVEEQERMRCFESEIAAKAYGDGENFDFSGLNYGDMVSMHRETAGIPELEKFHNAIQKAYMDQGGAYECGWATSADERRWVMRIDEQKLVRQVEEIVQGAMLEAMTSEVTSSTPGNQVPKVTCVPEVTRMGIRFDFDIQWQERKPDEGS